MSGTQQGGHLLLGEWEKFKSRNSWWGRMEGSVKKVGGREMWTSAKAVPVTLLATLQFLLNSFLNRCHHYQWETQHGLVHSLLGMVMKAKSRLFKVFVRWLVGWFVFFWWWILFLLLKLNHEVALFWSFCCCFYLLHDILGLGYYLVSQFFLPPDISSTIKISGIFLQETLKIWCTLQPGSAAKMNAL